MTTIPERRHLLVESAIAASRAATSVIHAQAARPGSSGVELVRQHAVLTQELSSTLLTLLAMGIEGALPETRIDALLVSLQAARMSWRRKHAAAEWARLPKEERREWIVDSGAATITSPIIGQDWEQLAPYLQDRLANRLAGEDNL